jgi:putative ABC transport system ATP-binding protein
MRQAGTTDIVRLEDVYKSYTTGKVVTEVLKGASLDVEENSFIVVFGPSGSGKTTLLNLIGALDKATSGQVWVDGRNLSEADSSSLEAFRRERLGFIFQFFNLLSNLTALENVELGLEIMGMRGPEVRERAMHYLEKVGLQDKADKFPNELAGGEQQRVAIARALAKEPKLLLADEPTGNLDEANSMKIAESMVKLHKELGTTFIVVTHNQRIAQMADMVYYISNGRIMGA